MYAAGLIVLIYVVNSLLIFLIYNINVPKDKTFFITPLFKPAKCGRFLYEIGVNFMQA